MRVGDSHGPGGTSSGFCCIATDEPPKIRAGTANWQETLRQEETEVSWILKQTTTKTWLCQKSQEHTRERMCHTFKRFMDSQSLPSGDNQKRRLNTRFMQVSNRSDYVITYNTNIQLCMKKWNISLENISGALDGFPGMSRIHLEKY